MAQEIKPLIVYMLCDVARRAVKQHYIGITRVDQFERRMRDHVEGRASITTKRMQEQGAKLKVTRLWRTDDWRLERQLKSRGHYERMCCACRGELLFDVRDMPERRTQDDASASPWESHSF